MVVECVGDGWHVEAAAFPVVVVRVDIQTTQESGVGLRVGVGPLGWSARQAG
ncbi:MAG: hypothetical protein ACP5P1_14610 [Acidimicrobiales bacterium]